MIELDPMHFPFSSYVGNFISRRLVHYLHRIPTLVRDRVIIEAQDALTEYLHSTRCISFTHAEHISKNSPSSLSSLLSKFRFSMYNVSKNLHRFLRYHPINEYEFFFESIGLPPPEIPDFLPPNQFFLSEDDGNLLPAVQALIEFGFPWTKLGTIYKEEVLVFSESPGKLKAQLLWFESLGFDRELVIGICLAFPFVLCRNSELDGEVDALFVVLKRIFYDFSLVDCVVGSLDVCHEICRKIKIFYKLGCEKGKMGELIGRNCQTLIEIAEEVFVKKVDFFSRLGMRKEDIGFLILQHPEILHFILEGPLITVSDYLKQTGDRKSVV